MPESLEQNEVDALLAAVDSGSVRSNAAGVEAAVASRRAQQVAHTVYDFKRPERVSKDQMRALQALHEGFGRNFGASLSTFLRTIIEVSVAHLEQLTYSEFIHSLPNPTCFNLLKSEQLDGQICLELSPLIVYPIIDRLLGGSNAELFIPQRPLTQIEQRLVERITERATTYLGEAWSAVTPVKFEVSDFESNPQLVQIVPPNETVVVVGFELKMGNRTGTMSLCIPYTAIEPIMNQLTAQTWFTTTKRGSNDASQKRLNQHLGSAPVELRTVLARTTLRMSDLLSLSVGDVITTDKPTDAPITIEIEGRPKFNGSLGKFRGNRAIRITRLVRGASAPEVPPPAPPGPPGPPAPAAAKAPAKR